MSAAKRKVPSRPTGKTKRKTGRKDVRTSSQGRPTKIITAESSHGSLSVREIDDLRAELARLQSSAAAPSRWNADPDDVRKSVGKLVLTLVEFIRRVLERQAIRRHEGGTLTPAEAEAVGMALMRLEETIADMARMFGLDPQDLNLDLGPLGPLY